jgi:hypothetical protein
MTGRAGIFLVSFLFIGLFFFLPNNLQGNAQAQNLTDGLTIISGQGDVSHDFRIEIAISPAQLQHGLMGRAQLKKDAGMLFWFGGEERERSFWMKDTLIPLDILFIKKDGTIHHIHHNAQPFDLTPLSSNGPVTAVLEINGGLSKTLGIETGDRVEQRFFQ